MSPSSQPHGSHRSDAYIYTNIDIYLYLYLLSCIYIYMYTYICMLLRQLALNVAFVSATRLTQVRH